MRLPFRIWTLVWKYSLRVSESLNTIFFPLALCDWFEKMSQKILILGLGKLTMLIFFSSNVISVTLISTISSEHMTTSLLLGKVFQIHPLLFCFSIGVCKCWTTFHSEYCLKSIIPLWLTLIELVKPQTYTLPMAEKL